MEELQEQSLQGIRDFRMPSYTEIPDVGLYLEQATRFVADYLKPLPGVSITGSMISNYVKKKLVKNPVKKQYYRDQIAVVLFIAVAKTVISLDEVQVLLQLQEDCYPCREAYEYFCAEMEGALKYVFEDADRMNPIGARNHREKVLLRNVVVAVAHKVYLDYSFGALMQERKEQ